MRIREAKKTLLTRGWWGHTNHVVNGHADFCVGQALEAVYEPLINRSRGPKREKIQAEFQADVRVVLKVGEQLFADDKEALGIKEFFSIPAVNDCRFRTWPQVLTWLDKSIAEAGELPLGEDEVA